MTVAFVTLLVIAGVLAIITVLLLMASAVDLFSSYEVDNAVELIVPLTGGGAVITAIAGLIVGLINVVVG